MPEAAIRIGTHALVLAAGAASRFGGGKVLAPYKSRPLIEWSIEAALASGVEGATVVVGSNGESVRQAVSALGHERVGTICCSLWAEGLSASLRCGVESLPEGLRAVLIFLGDMPEIPSALAMSLLDKVLAGAPAAMPTFYGRPGHPVAIAGAHLEALGSIQGDEGARRLLTTLGAVQIRTTHPGSVQDIDTREDLDLLDTKVAAR